jgi:hypothetical protein
VIPVWLAGFLGWWFGVAQAAPPVLNSIYMVMVDRFQSGDEHDGAHVNLADPEAFHGGDLAGLTAGLDHIQSMGFDTIWLSPITTMRTDPIDGHGAFHGYWVEDGSTLEPRFGTAADLDALRAALQDRSMGLVLDVVTNHVAPGSALTRLHPEWFHQNGDIEDWNDLDQRVTHDVHGLPDLAQERQAVRKHLVAEGEHWIETAQPTGFRLDAVSHLPMDFLREYTAAMRRAAGPGFALMGEVFDGNPVRVADVAAEAGLTHTFDFPLHYAMVDAICGSGDLRKLATVLSADGDYPRGHGHLNFVDNHDTARILTACGGDEDKVADVLRLMFALRGTPVITYGTEMGLRGATEAEVRSDMVFGRDTRAGRVIREGLRLRRANPVLSHGQTRFVSIAPDRLVLWRGGGADAVRLELGSQPKRRRKRTQPFFSDPGLVWLGLADGDSDDSITKSVTTIRFAPDDSWGQSPIWIVGSRRALGGWDPAKALGPVRAGETIEVEIDAASMVAFKAIRKRADGSVEWLSAENRYLWIDGESADAVVVELGR